MGYAPLVRTSLEGQVEIVEHPGNGGDSRNVRRHVKKWVQQAGGTRGLDAILFNCGLHDIKRKLRKDRNQQSLDAYRGNLQEIIDILEATTRAKLAWLTITPVIFQRHHAVKGFDRFEEDVDAYNRAALEIVSARGIRVIDLHGAIVEAGVVDAIREDGVHMTTTGNQVLASVVVAGILALARDLHGH